MDDKIHTSIGLCDILLVAWSTEYFTLDWDNTDHDAIENLEGQVFDICIEALVTSFAITSIAHIAINKGFKTELVIACIVYPHFSDSKLFLGGTTFKDWQLIGNLAYKIKACVAK